MSNMPREVWVYSDESGELYADTHGEGAAIPAVKYVRASAENTRSTATRDQVIALIREHRFKSGGESPDSNIYFALLESGYIRSDSQALIDDALPCHHECKHYADQAAYLRKFEDENSKLRKRLKAAEILYAESKMFASVMRERMELGQPPHHTDFKALEDTVKAWSKAQK